MRVLIYYFEKVNFYPIVTENNYVIINTARHLHKDVVCKLASCWSLAPFQNIGLFKVAGAPAS
jgi:hypothetical protein